MTRLRIVPTPGPKPFGILIDQASEQMIDVEGRKTAHREESVVSFMITTRDTIELEDDEPDPPADEFVQSERCGHPSTVQGVTCTKTPEHDYMHGAMLPGGEEVEWGSQAIPIRVYRNDNGEQISPHESWLSS